MREHKNLTKSLIYVATPSPTSCCTITHHYNSTHALPLTYTHTPPLPSHNPPPPPPPPKFSRRQLSPCSPKKTNKPGGGACMYVFVCMCIYRYT
jgi:hypothetical protein